MLFARCISPAALIRKCSTTALNSFHIKHKGKMVNFADFSLPVQYSDQTITASHVHTRTRASLFDVSHMLQTEVEGPQSIEFMESVCTADVAALKIGQAALTVFTNEKGGILDDLIVTKADTDRLMVVSNAGRRDHDKQLLLQAQKRFAGVKVKFFEPSERSLLALQGPAAAECLKKISSIDVDKLTFMKSTTGSVGGVDCCRVTRCGYTGEDGFEISVPSVMAEELAEEIMKNENVRLAGLGARDTLRLEAGLCLYGSDIDETTTPVEAGLTWLVAKSRRKRADFPGAAVINGQIEKGAARKRVGLMSKSPGPPARHGAPIYDPSSLSEPIGIVTSGCPSPTLNVNVAMGYVPKHFAKSGTELVYKIREKTFSAVVTKMPFVKSNYYTSS